MDLQSRVLTWLAGDDTGLSSEAMAFTTIGVACRSEHPHDPDDFGRCLRLVELIPEVRSHFSEIARLSPQWAAIIDNWDRIAECFVEEVGLNWEHGNEAHTTYGLMLSVLGGE